MYRGSTHFSDIAEMSRRNNKRGRDEIDLYPNEDLRKLSRALLCTYKKQQDSRNYQQLLLRLALFTADILTCHSRKGTGIYYNKTNNG